MEFMLANVPPSHVVKFASLAPSMKVVEIQDFSEIISYQRRLTLLSLIVEDEPTYTTEYYELDTTATTTVLISDTDIIQVYYPYKLIKEPHERQTY